MNIQLLDDESRDTAVDTDTGSDGDADVDVDVDIDTDSDIDADVDIDADIDVDADVDIDADVDTDTDSDSDTDSDQDTDIDSDTNSDTDSGTDFPCGGAIVGGYCWYRADPDVSCDDACQNHRGYNEEGTRDFAGSEGRHDNCKAVCTALGLPSHIFTLSGEPLGLGCTERLDQNTCHLVSMPQTNGWSAHNIFARFCACNE